MLTVDRRAPSTAWLLWRQLTHRSRLFWRNPLGALFTVAFPVVYLAIFAALFGDSRLVDGQWAEAGQPGGVRFVQVLTPAMIVFGVAMASYVETATSTAGDRVDGTLKRIQGAPIPGWIHLSARVASAVWVSLLATSLVMAVGALAYDVEIPWARVPAIALTVGIAGAALALLGLALVSLVPPGSVQAVALGTLLALSFISEVFIQAVELPPLLDGLSWTFPVRHLAASLMGTFDPTPAGAAIGWSHLAVVALWGAAGAAIVRWRFPWQPPR